jgi:hypothetical protein
MWETKLFRLLVTTILTQIICIDIYEENVKCVLLRSHSSELLKW